MRAHLMKKFIQITRHLYEEPHTVNLVFIVSNGRSMGHLEVLFARTSLEKLGEDLMKLQFYKKRRFAFTRGSELPADNRAWYFRFGIKNGKNEGQCRLNFRFNNNQDRSGMEIPREPPQLVDIEIRTDFSEFSKLGKAIYEFSQLECHRLYWCEEQLVLDDKLQNKSGIRVDVIDQAFRALWSHQEA